MGALAGALDWSNTSIGAVDTWPQSLRTSVSICLESRFPILLWWGPRLTMIYNDAYRPMLGASKHPGAMGQDGVDVWPEIWHIIGPMLEGVLRDGRATWSHDELLKLDRNGFLEECCFTFSCSPVREESGGIGGVFTAVYETTEQVVAARRLRLVRRLADAGAGARSEDEMMAGVGEALAAEREDVAFAALHLLDGAGRRARAALVAGVDVVKGEEVDLASPGPTADVLARVIATREAVDVEALDGAWAPHDRGGATPRQAVAVPVRGTDQPLGVLVAGINPRRPLDEGYRDFLDLAVRGLAIGLVDVRASEAERERAEALVALSTAKTQFFNNVSHEFRTPLTLLLGPLEEVLGDDALPPDDRERLQIVHRNALRLRRLVNALL